MPTPSYISGTCTVTVVPEGGIEGRLGQRIGLAHNLELARGVLLDGIREHLREDGLLLVQQARVLRRELVVLVGLNSTELATFLDVGSGDAPVSGRDEHRVESVNLRRFKREQVLRALVVDERQEVACLKNLQRLNTVMTKL